jgi:hypothetical protein
LPDALLPVVSGALVVVGAGLAACWAATCCAAADAAGDGVEAVSLSSSALVAGDADAFSPALEVLPHPDAAPAWDGAGVAVLLAAGDGLADADAGLDALA